MHIEQLKLEGFRNYTAATANFSPGINVVIGDNAQGKTNLLEAIYILGSAKSFRTRLTREIIGFECAFAHISGKIFSQNREQTLELRMLSTGTKQIFVNGVRQKSKTGLQEKLLSVLFCPDDLYLIKEGAAARRRLMDTAISQLRPRYALLLSEYGRLCQEKTKILRDFREKPNLLDLLPAYEQRMAQVGAWLIFYRAAWVQKLGETAKKIHEDFSGGKECLELQYKTIRLIEHPETKRPSTLEPLLLEHQYRHREAEKATGYLLSGPHKDDIEIRINGRLAKSFASQGQTRTAALSIKLAERELCQADVGEWPILLLDDVLSELDESRQDFVLNRVRGGQVILSCCADGDISKKTGGHLLFVQAGKIQEVL